MGYFVSIWNLLLRQEDGRVRWPTGKNMEQKVLEAQNVNPRKGDKAFYNIFELPSLY